MDKKKLDDIDIEQLEKERQLVKERLAQREREFDLLVHTKPERVKQIVTEGRNKRFNEIERKFKFMRQAQEEQTQEKLRKERFQKAAMRFGNIQNIDDIDEAIEDLDYKHKNIVEIQDGIIPLMGGVGEDSNSNLPKSSRFTSPRLEDEMRKSQQKRRKYRFDEQTEKERKYAEISRDQGVKKRLTDAYGPRIATYTHSLNNYKLHKLQDFYAPITEEKQIVLNSQLNSDLLMQIPDTANFDFMETHNLYTQRYKKFLKDQKYSDGMYKQILKDFSEIKAMKKVLTKIPSLDEPKIYSTKNETTTNLMDIKDQYEQKMKLVSNQFLKYDLSNDTILDDVQRYIVFGSDIVESESEVDVKKVHVQNAEKREEQKTTGIVDQLMNKVSINRKEGGSELRRSYNKGTAPHASILKTRNSRSRVNHTHHARFGS